MMHSLRNIILNFLLLTICIINSCSSISDTKVHNNKKNQTNQDNFLIVDHLSDNEKETRFKWKDLMGKETTLDMDNDNLSNSSLKMTALWQLTDGRSFAQLIFSSSNLIDCEYLEDGNDITNDFIDAFMSDYQQIRHRKFGGSKHMRHHQYHESSNMNHEEVLSIKSNITFIHLKKLQDIPEHLIELMNMKKLKKKCNELHRKIKDQFNNEEVNLEDKEIAEGGARTKRQSDSWFLAPNTKWCGKGSSADKYSELGASKGDTCCRKHDHCRVTIPGLQTKWSLFNMRPFTISHCRCDRRFRTCLKMADSSDANMVGKLFFNIVQIKCFVLKPEKACILYSWWGKCLKQKVKKRAYLRDNQKF